VESSSCYLLIYKSFHIFTFVKMGAATMGMVMISIWGTHFIFYCHFLDVWNVDLPLLCYELIESWEQFSKYLLVQISTIKWSNMTFYHSDWHRGQGMVMTFDTYIDNFLLLLCNYIRIKMFRHVEHDVLSMLEKV